MTVRDKYGHTQVKVTIFNREISFKQILGITSLLILIIAIPVGMYLIKQSQIIKSRADVEQQTRIEFVDDAGEVIFETAKRDVKLKLTYVASESEVEASPSAQPTVEPTSEPGVCADVITPAENPDTGECIEYPTPCDVPEGWTVTDSCPSVEGVSASEFPTSFRVANDSEVNLETAQEQDFNENGKIISWVLSEGAGEKTVFAQFKLNGVWQNPLSATITYSPPLPRRIFVTSSAFSGDLGGLSGADLKCQTAADGADLGGAWTAWVSTNTVNAVDRIPDDVYMLVDGTMVLHNKQEIASGSSVLIPINKDENGDLVSGEFAATGTGGDGISTNQTCNNWTSESSADSVTYGKTDQTFVSWTNLAAASCDQSRRLYCFEQTKPVSTSTPTPSPSQEATSSASPTPSPATEDHKKFDLNGDKVINAFDIALLFAQWRVNVRGNLGLYDLNKDGIINSFDYSILLTKFGKSV